jgi:uncharacterized protein (DUF924 family)
MRADDVLAYWLGVPATNADELKLQMRRWYQGGEEMDRAIAADFTHDTEQALAGALDGWAADPHGRVALILLLDQFARSLYRDTPKAYAGDPAAQRLCVEALDRGLEANLAIAERNFLIMPLLHAEELALQERGISEMDRFVAAAPPALQPIYAMGIEQSRKYRDVIARFGRFPHRNAVLGRTSTPEELDFLRDWSAKQPPTTR